MRLFVICPAHSATGGPHALHQLVHTARGMGADAHIVYTDVVDHMNPTASTFAGYDVSPVDEMVDEPDCVVVVPEIQAHRLMTLQHARPALWWLSVLYFEQYAERIQRALRTPDSPCEYVYTDPRILHLAQSEHAANHLCDLGIDNRLLTDYTPAAQISTLMASAEPERRPAVAYNPAKGMHLTEQVMRVTTDLEWVPLRGLKQDEVARELGRAAVYLDLGEHPGRDRIPREATIAGSVVVVGLQGSACNEVDVPLSDAYKVAVAPSFDASAVAALISSIAHDPVRHAEAQRPYRDWCLGQEAAFAAETSKLLEVCAAPQTAASTTVPIAKGGSGRSAGDRPPASIVIPVWNAAEITKSCLETLVPTLRDEDQIIVADNGSQDATPVLLAGWRNRVDSVRLPQNQGFAAGCNAGAALARNPIVVYLNNDTLPHGPWLDRLLAPFEDATVGATGPMSNFVSGAQLHHTWRQPMRDIRDVRRVASTAMAQGGSKTEETHRLVGFCLAVRTELVRSLDGFDEAFGIGGYEDDDLCNRIAATGHRLLIVKGSYVFHIGHSTFNANGLDWAQIEQQNRLVIERKQRDDLPLSVVLECSSDLVESASPLLPLFAMLKGLRSELLLIDDGTGTAQRLSAEISGGDVTVIDAAESATRQALAMARGARRILLQAGQPIEQSAVVAFFEDPAKGRAVLDLRAREVARTA